MEIINLGDPLKNSHANQVDRFSHMSTFARLIVQCEIDISVSGFNKNIKRCQFYLIVKQKKKKAIKAQDFSWHGKTDSHPVLLQADQTAQFTF